MEISNLLGQTEKFNKIINNLNNDNDIMIKGLNNSRLSFFTGNLYSEISSNILFITYDLSRIETIYEDLLRLLPEDRINVFTELEILPHEQLLPEMTITKNRIKALYNLLFNKKEQIFITTATALMRKLMPAKLFSKYSLQIKQGEFIDIKSITENLNLMGYERVAMIEGPEQYSVRGGIIDIFPIISNKPYRIEFFGDEVDSIRAFELNTQRSIKKLNSVHISPASEILLIPDKIKKILPLIKNDYERAIIRLKKINKGEEAAYLEEKSNEILEKLSEINRFPGYEQLLPYFYDKLDTVFDYLNNNTMIIVDREDIMWKRIIHFSREINETQASLLEQGSIIPSYAETFLSPEDFSYNFNKFSSLICTENPEIHLSKDYQIVNFNTKSMEPYHSQLTLLKERLQKLINNRYKIIITLNTESKAKKITSFLQDEGLNAIFTKKEIKNIDINVMADSFSEGFIFEDINLAVFTEKEVIGKPQRKKRQISELEEGVKISSINELSVGDYVVHENHGIGKYLGVKTLNVRGQHMDYLLIKYAGEDKLYVPTDQVNLVQKYIGADQTRPKLYKLGGSEWKKVKQKVQNSVKEMAIGLLELYAERETVKGYSFSPDTVWQKEFEEDFPYEETPDQAKSIEDVKQDMENSTPMDRLLCGDVGYGKTEVAIRAAFKAAVDGKQTAVLVPTTILAQQHFNTFSERINKYPIIVEMISRFKTQAEQKKILKKVSRGDIDIIIGTHRLLSKDVNFDDLGLLIVDEEQRFGVTHKERIKNLKLNVDVLTLTATPIPRTLHMALVGVRDMSVIETPPENRYPIRTFIREFNKELIKDTISREIGRDGQVYFVHNRVEDIDKRADMIKKLIPEARVAIAHGQMNENRLEKLMLDFYNKNYDVLVCTTIIETGLDIPNVNTIIINKSEQMGLAQLYQLRGRVGRSNRVAYAYLLYEKDRILSEVADKRLRAIKEFTNLGSGFKIAMRDLEIRGAGNLLGPEQHGHIASIGFTLYTKLLEDAIKDLKGNENRKETEVEIDLRKDAYIPDNYIKNSGQKIEIYKKIMKLESEEGLKEIKKELIDRYGKLPINVDYLLGIGELKIYARSLNIEKIVKENKFVNCYFKDTKSISGNVVLKIINENSRKIKVRSGQKPVLGLKISKKTNDIVYLRKIFKRLLELINTSN